MIGFLVPIFVVIISLMVAIYSKLDTISQLLQQLN